MNHLVRKKRYLLEMFILIFKNILIISNLCQFGWIQSNKYGQNLFLSITGQFFSSLIYILIYIFSKENINFDQLSLRNFLFLYITILILHTTSFKINYIFIFIIYYILRIYVMKCDSFLQLKLKNLITL